jgi:hypothetical protein
MGSNIDATTPAGRMMMQMVSGAEMARVYSISQPTMSRIVAQAQDTCKLCSGAKHKESPLDQHVSAVLGATDAYGTERCSGSHD